MRKMVAIVMLLVLTALSAVPIFAQERPTILELLQNDAEGRFTTLLAAIEAAGLEDTLNSEGPFTVLAPTNDAFDASLTFLGMSADDLFADTDLTREILLYHIIPGSFFFRDLTSGPTLDAALEGQTVTFDLTNGVFTVNNINILDTDNLASNGIVHVLEDGILLPPGSFPDAHLRVAHFSPDTDDIDVFLSGELSDVEGLAYGSVSDWMQVPMGVNSVAVAPTGTTMDEAVIGPVNVPLAPGSWTTLAIIGSTENGTLTTQPITEDFSEIPEGQARVIIFHAIEGAPAVDVIANDEVLVSELAYPGTAEDGTNDGVFATTVPADTYDIQVVETGTTSPVLLDLPDTELVEGTITLLAAIGTAASPDVAIVTTDPAAVMMEMETETPAPPPAQGATPAATEAATPEATEEPTAEATPEMTPETTPEATPEATPSS